MAIYKPSELFPFLSSLGTNAKKSLSQNFLIDGNIINKIVATAHVRPGETVIEIGPGPGALTEALLNAGAHVIAIEKDKVLAQALERLRAPGRHLQIYCEDILDFPLEAVISGSEKGKIIANLPYHITTPILVKCVSLHEKISTIVVMVQDEVARRFTAAPGTGIYGSFTVFLNHYSCPSYAFKVSRNSFYPVPKVESAVVTIELKEPNRSINPDKFFALTRTAFEHRRKMLRGSLRDLFSPSQIEDALVSIGKSSFARPEELSYDEFVDLYHRLYSNPVNGPLDRIHS